MGRPITAARFTMEVALGLSLCLATGCEEFGDDEGTLGELGEVRFSYERSCFFGCSLSQPLLPGTRELITLSGPGNDGDVMPESEDEDVAEVARVRDCFCQHGDDEDGRVEVSEAASCSGDWELVCENRIEVLAGKPGDTYLQLRDRRDQLVDQVVLHVHEPVDALFSARYADRPGEIRATDFEMKADTQVAMELTLYDEGGVKLLAPEGVTWRVDDPDVISLDAWLVDSGAVVDTGLEVTVRAHGPGEATLTVEVPDGEFSAGFTVQ